MAEELFSKGNITTIATWLAILITPIFVYFGIEVDNTAVIGIISTIITLGIAMYSSKHPNNMEMFGNKTPDVNITVPASQVDEKITDVLNQYEGINTVNIEVTDNETSDDVMEDGI